VLTIWRKALKFAVDEGKTPVLCLKEKGKEGFWVLCHSSHLVTVAKERALFARAVRDGLVKDPDAPKN
jgi:hypothetical protein